MKAIKGFTMVELLTVLIILGLLASVAIPDYTTMMQQGAFKAAQNNLMVINSAEQTYYLSNGAFCTTACSSTANVNSLLSLNIVDNNFWYYCGGTANNFNCYAQNNINASYYLYLTDNPIVTPGGQTCSSSTGPNPGCNPSCHAPSTVYCPS